MVAVSRRNGSVPRIRQTAGLDEPMPRGESLIRRLEARLMGLWSWWDALPERRMSERGLVELTDDQLKDLGIHRRDWRRRGMWFFAE